MGYIAIGDVPDHDGTLAMNRSSNSAAGSLTDGVKRSFPGVYREDLTTQADERLRHRVAGLCILIGICCATLGCAVYTYFGEQLVGTIWGLVALILMGDWILFGTGRIGWRAYVYVGCAPLPFAASASVIALGGLSASSGVIIWGLVAPLIMRAMIGGRESVTMVMIYLANLAASFVIPLFLRSTNELPNWAQDLVFLFNLSAASLFVIIVLYFFIDQRDRLQRQSDALLLNVLPARIAARLKGGETLIADTCTDVSIVFADVVGFTRLAGSLPPGDLIELLNEVFTRFDELLDLHAMEKIKTIGDCYMAAVGVPTPCANHAEIAVRFALDIRDESSRRDFNGHKLAFRIGVHSGHAVAGIIGQRKFSYDVWGDTVNTASRMESQGTAGCVQISETTRRLISDRFDCRSIGMLDIKGKGPMPVWHVLGYR